MKVLHSSLATLLLLSFTPLFGQSLSISSKASLQTTKWLEKSSTRTTPSNTKIVATIGPASSSEDSLTKLMQAGVDCCRLNFSHGRHEEHQQVFDRIRELCGNQVAILCDIQGPKIRTGEIDEPFLLRENDLIRVTPETCVGTKERIQISYESMMDDLQVGDYIYINDGIIKLVVIDKEATDLVCECLSSGTISSRKGCNMPSGKLSVNVVTPKDAADLAFIAKELNPEYVAASFVGTAADVEKVRARLSECGNDEIKVVAKVERPIALENLDDIIQASDAVMVARGDLGVEIDAWDVPMWQKEIVRRCNVESKPVIMATQMLESMCNNNRPTRAEASDVYNAVHDGADAVMLSGETSVGKYPIETVRVMENIVRVAQGSMPKRNLDDYDSSEQGLTESVCHGACEIATEAIDLDISGKIVVVTETGKSARLISKYRPALPIVAFSESDRTVRELALVWGVRAHHIPQIHSLPLEERAIKAIREACDIGYIDENDTHVGVVSTSRFSNSGFYTGAYELRKLSEKGLI